MTQEGWQRQLVKMLQFVDGIQNKTIENTIDKLSKTNPKLLSYVDYKKFPTNRLVSKLSSSAD